MTNMNEASQSLPRRRGPGKKDKFFQNVDKNGPLPDQTKYPGLDRCWVWTAGATSAGYGGAWRGGKWIAAHRLSYEKMIGYIPNGLWVLHKCDNPLCVNPDHLYLGTRKNNTSDAVIRNRLSKGERHGRSDLSDSDVMQMRIDRSSGMLLREISAKHGISLQAVHMIVTRKNWKHVA